MNINTLSETGGITIFQDANTGNTYIVEPVLGTTEPIDMADEPYLFIGDCDDFMRSDNPVFKTLGRYIAVHDETPANVGEYTKLFKGELCSHFKCVDGWEDYDFIESYGQILAVNKRLGDAEEWLCYLNMWDDGKVYYVLDCSTGIKVTDIYAEYHEDALELYLRDGELASLKAQVNKAMRGE